MTAILLLLSLRADPDSGEEPSPPTKKRCHTSPTHPCSSTAAGSSTTAATAAKKGKGKAPKTQRVAKKRASAPTQLYVGEDEDKWHNVSDEDEQPHLPSFQPKRAPGPQLISTATYSPLQLFQLFFSISVVTSKAEIHGAEVCM